MRQEVSDIQNSFFPPLVQFIAFPSFIHFSEKISLPSRTVSIKNKQACSCIPYSPSSCLPLQLFYARQHVDYDVIMEIIFPDGLNRSYPTCALNLWPTNNTIWLVFKPTEQVFNKAQAGGMQPLSTGYKCDRPRGIVLQPFVG